MVTYSDKLYLSESINEKKLNKIKRNISQGRGRFDLYILSLSNNEHNQLDIFHNAMFKQKLYRMFDIRIVGLASSYEESLIVMQKILEDSLSETGKADMKSYLLGSFN